MEGTLRSIRDEADCTEAARQVKDGQVVGSYIRGVCGLWIDGASTRAIQRIDRVKGEQRKGRPLGTTLDGPEFASMIDPDRIVSSARSLFLDADRLGSRLGSLCFIRIPIRGQRARDLPPRLVSQSEDGIFWLQNWIPSGGRSSERWMESMRAQHIAFPSATSMNLSGTPELVDQEQGRAFCEAHSIAIFLGDTESRSGVKGSFPILQVDRDGIHLLREGHFPGPLFRHLLPEWQIDLGGYKPAKYPLAEMPEELLNGAVTGEALRLALIAHLDG